MKSILDRIFVDGLGGMAHGLFATLIIGTIIQQIGLFAGGDFWEYAVYGGKDGGGDDRCRDRCRCGKEILMQISWLSYRRRR